MTEAAPTLAQIPAAHSEGTVASAGQVKQLSEADSFAPATSLTAFAPTVGPNPTEREAVLDTATRNAFFTAKLPQGLGNSLGKVIRAAEFSLGHIRDRDPRQALASRQAEVSRRQQEAVRIWKQQEHHGAKADAHWKTVENLVLRIAGGNDALFDRLTLLTTDATAIESLWQIAARG